MTYEIDLKSVTSELSIPKGGSEEVLHKNRESYTRWRVNLFQWDFFPSRGVTMNLGYMSLLQFIVTSLGLARALREFLFFSYIML